MALLALSLWLMIVVTFCRVQAKELPTYEDHPCIRPCEVDRPRNCKYEFTLEYYETQSKACYDCPSNKTDCYRPHCIASDGVSRGVVVANRQLPGPAIHVCKGDNIIVDVKNRMTQAEGTSIHWHGIHQRGSQHMDGISMVTQCPIPAFSKFQYKFSADNPGTHYWHAHSGMQRSDGLFGALVVREPPETEPHLGLYEEDLPEHTMIVHDWLVELAINRFVRHHHAGGDNKPRSMLINGRGVLQDFFDNDDNTTTYTPVEIFKVTQGKRYRFRTISNGILNCPIQVSIDNHTLTMIAADGTPFEKREVQSFNIFAGERFDFMLNASLPVDNYWVRVRGLADCGVKQAKQVAILRYDGAPDVDPPETTTWEDADREGMKLNPWNRKDADDLIQVTELISLLDDDISLKEVPDKRFYLAFDFNKVDNYHFHDETYYPISEVAKPMHLYMPQINHISSTLPSSPPLSQLLDLDESIFCDHEEISAAKNCTDDFCECVHRLQVNLGDVVEIVNIDEGVTFNANHPMHLHGHTYRVVGMGKLAESTSIEEVKRLDAEGKLHRNLHKAIAKDTVTVPDGGYTIIRFHANNPGFWFYHCHIEFHVDIGMGLLIQTGNATQLPRIPHNFPKCGNWEFDGTYEDRVEEPDSCVSGSSKLLAGIIGISMGMALIVLNTVEPL